MIIQAVPFKHANKEALGLLGMSHPNLARIEQIFIDDISNEVLEIYDVYDEEKNNFLSKNHSIDKFVLFVYESSQEFKSLYDYNRSSNVRSKENYE